MFDLDKRKAIDKAIDAVVPRRLDNRKLAKICGKARYRYDVATAQKAVNDLVWDLLDRGGKRWRPTLMLTVAEAVGGKKGLKKAWKYVAIPEVVHNGTLAIDDLEDNSLMRRGKPCLNIKYGVDLAVNAGSAMYFLPLLPLVNNKKDDELILEAFRIYAKEMIAISYGQGFDIYWHKGLTKKVTEEQYLQMCAYKTGTLARMSAKMGALFAGGTKKQINSMGGLAESLGIAFQIQDDVLNLLGEEEVYGKEVGGDVTEGKRTLMVIHAFNHSKQAKELERILNAHSRDGNEIRKAITIMRDAGSLDYAKQTAQEIVRQAWRKTGRVLKESKAKQELKALADYTINREL